MRWNIGAVLKRVDGGGATCLQEIIVNTVYWLIRSLISDG